jgi:hypothetical protein
MEQGIPEGGRSEVQSEQQTPVLHPVFANCEMSQCKWAGLKKVSTMHKRVHGNLGEDLMKGKRGMPTTSGRRQCSRI